jgi:hypothetical protein
MIIGINGKIGSGKDTIGNIIQYLTDKNVTTESFEFWYASNFYSVYQSTGLFKVKKFADKLKDIVCLLIGCTREQLENGEFKNTELDEQWWFNHVIPENGFGKKLINWDKNLNPQKMTPRLLMQLLGTDCGRNIIHPNIWVNSLMSEYICKDCSWEEEQKGTINACSGKHKLPNWIITDMRFSNELNAVKQKNGITIRVNRDNGTRVIDINPHESETALDRSEFDYTIENDGTIEELIDKIKEILIKEKLL